MFIEKIEQNTIKINFYANEEEIYIGDLLKVVALGKKGVLAQVIKIESPENNQNYNTATSKILFTVETSGKLSEWQGNVPGNDFMVNKASPKEILAITRTGKVKTPALSGKLSGYPEVDVNLEAAFLEKPTVIIGDKENQKNEFLELLAINLSEKNAKVVLIDYNGEFSEDEEAVVLKAGKDVKLPFDRSGIESLYNKVLANVSGEIRANIENIFEEIEDYLTAKKVSFLPFKVFVDAVNTESKANSMPELDLLSNSLSKLRKKGVFADSQREIVYLFNTINESNQIILDLSEIDREWKPLFVDFIIRLNKEKLKRKFFLLMDLDKYSSYSRTDYSDISEKIFNHGVKSGIKPIVSVRHNSEITVDVASEVENTFVFCPQNESKMTSLHHYLSRIGDSDVLVSGKITNNVPLYIKLPVFEELEGEFFSAEVDSQPMIEIEGSLKAPEPVQSASPQPVVSSKSLAEEEIEAQEVSIPSPVESEDIEPAYQPVQPQYTSPQEEADEEEEIKDYFSESENSQIQFIPEDKEDPETEEHEFSEEDREYEEEQPPYSMDSEPEEETEYMEEEEGSQELNEPQPQYNEEVPATEAKSAYELALEEMNSDDDQIEGISEPAVEYQDEPPADYTEDEEEKDYQDESPEDYAGPKENSQLTGTESEFSNKNLNNFMDYNEEESEEAKEDEESYYESSEEFQDENVLDYAEPEETAEDDEDTYYESSEEFQDESALDYATPEALEDEKEVSGDEDEFSEEDLQNFMDYDEKTDKPQKQRELGEEDEYDEQEIEPEDEQVAEAPPKKSRVKKPEPFEEEEEKIPGPPAPNLPVYNVPENEDGETVVSSEELKEGDTVRHKKYGIGIIKKVIGYSEKKLCSIQFEDVGRRLLDPKIAELEKV